MSERLDDGTEDFDRRCTGTEGCICPLCIAEDEDQYDPEERDCYRCGGDGWVECWDSLQCTRRHNTLGECECGSCGGSGLAKDMTIW